MYTKNYNINNILKLQIKTDNRSLLKGLNFPLTYFEIPDTLNNPDILLTIGKFKPSNNDCSIVDHKYHIKKNYFSCKESEGKSKCEVEIIGFEKPPTVINFNGKVGGIRHFLAADLLPQDNILFPLIEFFLGMKGFFLAHGGGVVAQEKAILFLGRSGSQKTTIIMNAVRHDSKILGDDRVILDTRDKRVYGFPIFPRIFEYIIKNSDDEYLNYFKKVMLMKNLLKDISPTSQSQMWQREPVKIKSIYLLKRKNTGNDKINIYPIAKECAIQKIIANNKAEMNSSSIPSVKKRNFLSYMTAYSFIFPDSRLTTYWDNVTNKLGEMLRNIPIYEMEVPLQNSLNKYQNLGNLIGEMK